MPRKNKAAKRRGRRLDRRIKGEPRVPKLVHNRRLPLEELVIPDGQCSFRSRKPKAVFLTEEKAAEALAQAQLQRKWDGSTYFERRYYACREGGCGGYHLSSREEFEELPWRGGEWK